MNRWSARVEPEWDLQAWRSVARAALQAEIPPEHIDWLGGAQDSLLSAPDVLSAPPLHVSPGVPADFVTLADTVLCHSDASRHALLYRLLWRLTHGEKHLLDQAIDADTHRANELAQSVRRDAHKMKAFVRFREVPGETDRFIAWFEPAHCIVDRVAPFFARRFTGMRWAILTPYRSVYWDGAALAFGPGGRRQDAPPDDAGEDLWRTYYANIFNPARLNPRMMQQEMPRKYWKHLPEASLLPQLIHDAGARVRDMAEREHAAPRRRIPVAPEPEIAVEAEDVTLDTLRVAAATCRACPLWQPATQTVFGEGPPDARIVLVGEQPGDQEDLSGRPFVGPAGKILDEALREAGLDRSQLYLTNAVKHFHFEQRGKFRLHKNPQRQHIQACKHWLTSELQLLQPKAIVCLGASAATSLFGTSFRLMAQRGQWQIREDGTRAFATVHPSFVLRQRTEDERAKTYEMLVEDLRLLAEST